jgi:hypothetical protein
MCAADRLQYFHQIGKETNERHPFKKKHTHTHTQKKNFKISVIKKYISCRLACLFRNQRPKTWKPQLTSLSLPVKIGKMEKDRNRN